MDINIVFCRELLRLAHADVRKHYPGIKVSKAAWVYSYGRTWEFHGPDGFYWHGRAGNAYDARAKGWHAYLRYQGKEE